MGKFKTATRAAARGEARERARRCAERHAGHRHARGARGEDRRGSRAIWVDCALWGLVRNVDQLSGMVADSVAGFKAASSVTPGLIRFPAVERADLERHAAASGTGCTACSFRRAESEIPRMSADMPSAPPVAMLDPVVGGPCRRDGHRHGRADGVSGAFVHLSSATALPMIPGTRRGLPITVETCPASAWWRKTCPKEPPSTSAHHPFVVPENRACSRRAAEGVIVKSS